MTNLPEEVSKTIHIVDHDVETWIGADDETRTPVQLTTRTSFPQSSIPVVNSGGMKTPKYVSFIGDLTGAFLTLLPDFCIKSGQPFWSSILNGAGEVVLVRGYLTNNIYFGEFQFPPVFLPPREHFYQDRGSASDYRRLFSTPHWRLPSTKPVIVESIEGSHSLRISVHIVDAGAKIALSIDPIWFQHDGQSCLMSHILLDARSMYQVNSYNPPPNILAKIIELNEMYRDETYTDGNSW